MINSCGDIPNDTILISIRSARPASAMRMSTGQLKVPTMARPRPLFRPPDSRTSLSAFAPRMIPSRASTPTTRIDTTANPASCRGMYWRGISDIVLSMTENAPMPRTTAAAASRRLTPVRIAEAVANRAVPDVESGTIEAGTGGVAAAPLSSEYSGCDRVISSTRVWTSPADWKRASRSFSSARITTSSMRESMGDLSDGGAKRPRGNSPVSNS